MLMLRVLLRPSMPGKQIDSCSPEKRKAVQRSRLERGEDEEGMGSAG
jgi:hypothetical protein